MSIRLKLTKVNTFDLMAISKMNKAQLMEALIEEQQVVSSHDSVVELRAQLYKLRKDKATDTDPLGIKGIASMTKHQLIERGTELGLTFSPTDRNADMVRAIKRKAALAAPAKGTDVFGIEPHCGRQYRDLRQNFPEYCNSLMAKRPFSESTHWEIVRFGRYMERSLSPEPTRISISTPKTRIKKEESQEAEIKKLKEEIEDLKSIVKKRDPPADGAKMEGDPEVILKLMERVVKLEEKSEKSTQEESYSSQSQPTGRATPRR